MLKSLLLKREDLGLDPQHPQESLAGMVMCVCNPIAGKAETGEPLDGSGPDSLAELLGSR